MVSSKNVGRTEKAVLGDIKSLVHGFFHAL